MRLLITTNGRLYKGPDNRYYTPIVYGYDFFKTYLQVFEQVRLVAHVENASAESVKTMLWVNGPGVEVFEMPFPHGKWAYIKSALSIQKRANLAIDGCDAALFRIPDPLAFQIFPCCRRRKIPTAVEVTSDPLVLYSSLGGRYPLRLFIKWSHYWEMRYCCRKADGVSYVTASYLQSVYPSGVQQNEERRFESYYTDTGLEEHDSPVRDYPIRGKISLLHIAGSLSGRVKGHKELIEAFVTLKKKGYDLSLTLVGSGRLDEDVQRLLEESGNQEDVSFTGFLHKEQIDELYRRSDIFVFPSYREGLPRVVVDAMSWSLPCISTDIPGCRELLSPDVLVPVADAVALTDTLERYLKNQELLKKEGQKNRLVSMDYSNLRVLVRRLDFYKKLKSLA